MIREVWQGQHLEVTITVPWVNSILHKLKVKFFLEKATPVCSNKSQWKFINHSLGKLTNIY